MLRPLPVAYIAHAATGRTRLRVPSRQGDVEFFTACAARLAEIEGVLGVQPRALTASLLVEHDIDLEAIAEHARAAGLFAIAADPGEREADRAPALPALAGLLGTLAVVQLFRNRVLPPAITLAWYALALARDAQPRRPTRRDK